MESWTFTNRVRSRRLFRSVAKAIMPMVKSGGKTLGNIALSSGANLLGDVLAGKNVKNAAKSRLTEAKNVVKQRAINKLHTLSQTGSGRRRSAKRKDKKRKFSFPTTTSSRNKRRKTTRVEDIFG